MLRSKLCFEPLEDRRMLAVTTNFNTGSGLLSISGDSASDNVVVEGRGAMGVLEVEVNGVIQLIRQGVNKINVSMGSGNDDLNISALLIGGSLTVNMGSGGDEIDIDDQANGVGSAVDGKVFIGGHVTLNMGGDANDFVEFDSQSGFAISIGGNLKVLHVADLELDGNGGTRTAEASDINLGGSLTVQLSTFGDVNGDGLDVLIDDSNVGGTTTITGSSAGDIVRIVDSTFARDVNVSLLGGNDRLDLDDSGDDNRFSTHLKFNGGSGTDIFDNVGGNIFGFPPSFVSVEVQT